MIRHPLDVALSDRDHMANMDREHAVKMREAVAGRYEPARESEEAPEDPADFLRWFIDNDEQPTGSGPERPGGLLPADPHLLGRARQQPNVHLFHYADMWNDLDAEMRRVAAALGVAVDEGELAGVRGGGNAGRRCEPARPRRRRTPTLGLWKSSEGFFRVAVPATGRHY